MQYEFYHNSYLEIYRSPFGAAECNQNITMRLQAPINFCGYCALRLWVNDVEKLIQMEKVNFTDDELREGKVYYEASFKAPSKPGLVWYYFCIADDRSVKYYGNNPSLKGGEGWFYDYSPAAYQITIYKKTTTPNWWKEGLIYQIFPDRFCNGNIDNKINSPKPGSLLQANWYDKPSYQKDEDGKIISWIFAGGNFKGITSKLEYLADMGISIIYLNPIFESRSCHRYDTADYKKVDPMLGTEEDFDEMIEVGKKYGINFILDGVFSHTGQDSKYFNRLGTYGSDGAYQNKNSEYYSWYKFENYPDKYECWWNVEDLPDIDKLNNSFQNYICNDEDSVIRTWIRRGVMGFRLDVADELPDEFIKLLRKTIKEENPEAVLIGEVWEDASNKESYGVLKEYFYGEELDGVMNYPFREALLDFAMDKISANEAMGKIMGVMENAPIENLLGTMTMLGSHDRPRLLTVLGGACSSSGEEYKKLTNIEKQQFRLSEIAYKKAIVKLQMATALLYALPGTPSIYYGEEAGMQGFVDPYNRGTYPWDKEDKELKGWYSNLGNIRKEYLSKFTSETYQPIDVNSDVLGFKVKKDYETLYVFSNKSEFKCEEMTFDSNLEKPHCIELIEAEVIIPLSSNGDNTVYRQIIPPMTTRIFIVKDKSGLQELHRSAGVLLHITSLGGDFDSGDLGENAYKFIDFLKETGQKIWQILPLNIPGGSSSPYQALSSYAGNPLLISMDKLVNYGLLSDKELEVSKSKIKIVKNKIDFNNKTVLNERTRLLNLAYKNFLNKDTDCDEKKRYLSFVEKNRFWLEDFALFYAINKEKNEVPWHKWKEEGLRNRVKADIEAAVTKYDEDIKLCYFEQFIFDIQWESLREYAKSNGIIIVGDVPICVSPDSVDVWTNPKLFKLNEDGSPSKISGVPPDFFSKDGQLWGTPVFDWKEHKADGFTWWKNRISYELAKVDYIRLDHFRGFSAYWEVDAKDKTSEYGNWKRGGGIEFFETLENDLGKLNIIAEDLGHITKDVHNLKNYFNYPGMEVYQFSDILKDDKKSDSLNNKVLYTGTHDNDTLLNWIITEKNLNPSDKEDLEKAKKAVREIIEKLYDKEAPWVIIPLQDLLQLGVSARMNVPGEVSDDNWSWKLSKENYEELVKKDFVDWIKTNIVRTNR